MRNCLSAGLDYEQYYGTAPIFSARFAIGILVEFVGTYLINLCGLLACLLHSSDVYNTAVLNVALAFGLAFLIVSTILQRVSTCHFNPAASLYSLFLGHLTVLYCFLSFLVQLAAVVLATATLAAVVGQQFHMKYTTVFKPADVTLTGVLIAEFTGTLVVLCAKTIPHTENRLVETFAIIACLVAFIPFSGGSLNPARAFGPALATNDIPDYYWIYWLGPLTASAIASLLFFTSILHNSNSL